MVLVEWLTAFDDLQISFRLDLINLNSIRYDTFVEEKCLYVMKGTIARNAFCIPFGKHYYGVAAIQNNETLLISLNQITTKSFTYIYISL